MDWGAGNAGAAKSELTLAREIPATTNMILLFIRTFPEAIGFVNIASTPYNGIISPRSRNFFLFDRDRRRTDAISCGRSKISHTLPRSTRASRVGGGASPQSCACGCTKLSCDQTPSPSASISLSLEIVAGRDDFGLRWQSEAATPLWQCRPARRKRRGASLGAAVQKVWLRLSRVAKNAKLALPPA